jgi:urocanate hydratase
LAAKVNEAVGSGALKGPVAFTRDHLDGGSAAMPFRETGNMRDGSDAIADWPILNALLNGAAGADLVAIHGLADYGKSAGLTIVADGTSAAAERLRNTLDCDTGMGILRHADAGYKDALAARARTHLGLHPRD